MGYALNIKEAALGWTEPDALTTLRSDTMSASLFPATPLFFSKVPCPQPHTVGLQGQSFISIVTKKL